MTIGIRPDMTILWLITDNKPGHRSQLQGLAQALVRHAESRAKLLALAVLELQTRVELTENHAAFRAMGFAETGRTAHEGFDRPTTITFRKPVA